jgi:hypothetical protein
LDLFQMKQYVNEPTRVTNTTSTCLDLIILQCQHLATRIEVLPEICSDHRVPCIYISNNKPKERPFKRTIYDYKKLDQGKFIDLMNNTDWESVLMTEDIDTSANNFTTTFINLAKQCMPNKQITVRPKDAPWINNEIRILIAEKDKIYKTARKKNTNDDWEKFRKCRNHLTSKIRERKLQYLKELDTLASNPEKFNTKEWWKLVKTFLSKKGMESNEIPPLESDGRIYYSNKEKANILNNFFISQSTIPNETDPIPELAFSEGPVLSSLQLSLSDVRNAINNLNVNKSVGPDLIHNCLLKAAINHISEPLTAFFNKCLSNCRFPLMWKIAHVTPLFKKGLKESCSNYRPISLLSCVGKVFESCVHKHILHFLSENNILTQSQSGFLPGDSTTNQLLSIYNDLSNSFDRGITTQAVYLDITKAFDRVWHKGLLSKLNAIGIRGNLLKWLQDYLSNRTQATVVKGEKSQFQTVRAGVPQGSVIGPLLFLVYINDIVDNVNSTIKLFADDTSLSLALGNPDTRADLLNRDLENISDWALKWKVIFNEAKTKVINYARGTDQCYALRFGNAELCTTTHHKHLGTILQNNLKWDIHIRGIASRVNMLISCLSSYKYKLGRKALETLYKSFVMPHFDYADIVWDNCTAVLSNLLEDLHLKALRVITGSVRGTSHQLLYEESGFCTLKERRRRHKLTAYKKITLGICPDYLSNLLPPLVSETNPYPRRRPHQRTVPTYRTETYHKSFFPSATELWNELPVFLQSTTSISSFKRHFTHTDTTVPPYYYLGERNEQIIHCRLRLGMSNLNNDLFNRKLQNNRLCVCKQDFETASHYLLFCDNYSNSRHLTISTLPLSWRDTKTLLFGNSNLQLRDNIKIFVCVHDFIKQSGRFT